MNTLTHRIMHLAIVDITDSHSLCLLTYWHVFIPCPVLLAFVFYSSPLLLVELLDQDPPHLGFSRFLPELLLQPRFFPDRLQEVDIILCQDPRLVLTQSIAVMIHLNRLPSI
uniref:Uncharacterized protein n=1 Tax=Chromera velia CCMP2878 TaxID=1169474 RepID=A0A0G4FJQ2_9ALVE|eukprot:Cvel_17345.t1-p1 / transcript=Cvel_17345.t1 / gene=Cvel_17345 / organism=Chromera_velia_CCMP2878 / gene_product=hypothetical protein / transcript_product=hypothetical protein / location=Cvel_scaffold1378:36685-38460(+) / protein_length=111 / sequence_SO=supercontig / SO=protein_coding / is_pseudo=false